ncbi:hypothetical protein Ancab_020042 [Ancistrocladus abbreviatus]
MLMLTASSLSLRVNIPINFLHNYIFWVSRTKICWEIWWTGKGTVTLVFPDKRQSFNVECGHIMVIPAGATAYMVNRDDKEKLILAKLIIPVATPGNFEVIAISPLSLYFCLLFMHYTKNWSFF